MTAAPPINDDIVESSSANETQKRAASDRSPGGQAQMPLPSVRDVFQGGLFVIASLAALYAGRQIAVPIVLAITLKPLLQPALRTLQRFRVPGALGALLLIGSTGSRAWLLLVTSSEGSLALSSFENRGGRGRSLGMLGTPWIGPLISELVKISTKFAA